MNDERLLQQVADRAAKKAVEDAVPHVVRQTLITMGLDPDNPLEAQKDAQFLRSTRNRCEQAGSKGVIVLVALVTAGIAAAVWDSIKRTLQ